MAKTPHVSSRHAQNFSTPAIRLRSSFHGVYCNSWSIVWSGLFLWRGNVEAGGCRSEFQCLHSIKTVKVTVDIFLLLTYGWLLYCQILRARTNRKGVGEAALLTRKQSCFTCCASPWAQVRSSLGSQQSIIFSPLTAWTESTFSRVHRTPSHGSEDGRQCVDTD